MISINIWDDFYEEGFVPEGQIQETYMYIEGDTSCEYNHKGVLEEVLCKLLNYRLNSGIEYCLVKYDSKKEFPNVPNGWSGHFSRWQINIKHITHDQIDILEDRLNEETWECGDIEFYSES